MTSTQTLDVLEKAFRAVLPSEWHVERSLTFAGITPDFLLVHPERGVVVVGVVEPPPEFRFETYDYGLATQEKQKELVDEQKTLLGSTQCPPGWSGLADPRELLLDWRKELEDYFSGLIEREQIRLLRSVLVVIQQAEPEDSKRIFSFVSGKTSAKLNVEWINTSDKPVAEHDRGAFVARVVPQAFTEEKPMPENIWKRLKREVLGTEDAVLGISPPPDFRFDPQQLRILEYLSTPGLKRFRGPAGSGKTLIIARKVADAVARGERVLVVVYNKTMCQMIQTRALFFLNENVADAEERKKNNQRLITQTFITWQDRWWARVCSATGLEKERRKIYAAEKSDDGRPFVGDNEAKIYVEKKTPPLVLQGLKKASRGVSKSLFYDLVIADEAQNMFPENWDCLKEAGLPETSTVVAVADPTQSLYGDKPWTDQRMSGFSKNPWREMKASYRLPDDYLEFVGEFLNKFPPDDDVVIPAQVGNRVLSSSTLFRVSPAPGEHPKDAIFAAVNYAIHTLNFLPHQIVFLVPTNSRGTAVVRMLRKHGIEVTYTFEQGNRPTFGTTDEVRGSTFHSYAGWESPCVILDTGFVEKQKNTNGLLYSGLTRLARRDIGSAMIIVESDNQYRGLIRQYCVEIPNQ